MLSQGDLHSLPFHLLPLSQGPQQRVWIRVGGKNRIAFQFRNLQQHHFDKLAAECGK